MSLGLLLGLAGGVQKVVLHFGQGVRLGVGLGVPHAFGVVVCLGVVFGFA